MNATHHHPNPRRRRHEGAVRRGAVRIAYDADTQEYTWQHPDGVKLEGTDYGPLRVVPQWRPPPPPPPGTPWPCACCSKDKNERPTLCECGPKCPVTNYDIPCVKCAEHCDAAWHKAKPGQPLNIATTPSHTDPSPFDDTLLSAPPSAPKDGTKKSQGKLLRSMSSLFKRKD
ncbi:hypothetical protein CONLIGDRAFT_629295 [Coniochaeta ligniaria NRRL 30616]|uniref:Uncharacterized protein n=1 Tax=Coniochaeta ligniaria NRRL 30616 TaxID=1408157 RepID=A0A1J7JE80_9PEZI|nr:hypothetical protein CONLIGDRAFT_629295 [Coniochaeta ligniaria NRRL 30616]